MAKTKITEGIETALNDMCRSKRLYGCEEVTIVFPNNGHGNEIVDFMTMDSNQKQRKVGTGITIISL